MERRQIMKKWNIIIDVERCHNCNNCFLTTKDEYVGNSFPGYSLPQPHHGHHWIKILRRERSEGSQMEVAYLPTTCNQCDDSPCLRAAQNGAVYKREDGILMIDPEKSKGQKQIVDACPFGHIWWNEELNVPQKWSMDAHLLDAGWKEPRPVTVCASEAFKAVLIEDSEMAVLAKADGLEHYNAEAEKTRSRLYYKNLYKFNKEFIAGSVTKTAKEGVDTAEGVKVALIKDGSVIAEYYTDCFGDFKFDKLPSNSGKYTVKVFAGEKEIKRDVELKLSVTVEDIDLSSK
jgi:Fe-S-cluster-containing dehydrogenase component